MVFRYLLFVFVVCITGCDKHEIPASQGFQNPLLPGGPDPWVFQKDSFYYYTHTSSDKIELRRTRTMSRLQNAEMKVIFRAPATGINSHHIWAPELHFLDEKW